MGRLSARFPDFLEAYDGPRMRAFVRHVEQLFARVWVDETGPAYTVATNTTLSSSDDVVLVDTSGGSVTITLPEISDSMVKQKREFEIVHAASTGTTTITPTGADTILWDTNATMTVLGTALRLRATTGNWIAI